MNTNFKSIERKIVADGWTLVRIKGSHYLYYKVGESDPLVIPNHNGKDLSIGIIKYLEKRTGLPLRR